MQWPFPDVLYIYQPHEFIDKKVFSSPSHSGYGSQVVVPALIDFNSSFDNFWKFFISNLFFGFSYSISFSDTTLIKIQIIFEIKTYKINTFYSGWLFNNLWSSSVLRWIWLNSFFLCFYCNFILKKVENSWILLQTI